MILNQSRFSGNGATSESSIADAYKALGLTSESTDQEIKKTYRKLMSQNHPDKLMGQGLPEDMIKVATERSQEIQAAYDYLKKHRNEI
jgi:DnaJ like chaperone protein